MSGTERARGPARVTVGETLRGAIDPFREFAQTEASGGVFLLLCAVLALVWANSPWDSAYIDLFHTNISIAIGEYSISTSFVHWINDGLMAIFFCVVGLEIKREVLAGELSSPRQAALPVVAAVGGMVVPALIYVAVNAGGDGVHGWGIPMATDIAFSLGVLALLGSRVPAALKVFLTALAIVDDIGAVLVIAIFYSTGISMQYMLLALVVLAALFAVNRLGVRNAWPYVALGIVLWIAVYQSGVHATVAGVLLALMIPAGSSKDAGALVARARDVLDPIFDYDADEDLGRRILTDERYSAALEEAHAIRISLQPPLQRFEHALHPWVAFLIMPLFALANAGVALPGDPLGTLGEPVTLGVVFGLVVGKPLGISVCTWLGVRAGILQLPQGVAWRQVLSVGCVAGIGFTMSLFIANLAFDDAAHLDNAKLGILGASLIAGVVGYAALRFAGNAGEHTGAAETA